VKGEKDMATVFGDFNKLTYALIIFVVIDYITGVMCAVANKTLSSDVGYRGIFKKIIIFEVVAIGHIVDNVFHIAGMDENHAVISTAIIVFYLANEGLSFLENATRLGLPVPKKLKDALAKLHEKDEKEEHQNDHHPGLHPRGAQEPPGQGESHEVHHDPQHGQSRQRRGREKPRRIRQKRWRR